MRISLGAALAALVVTLSACGPDEDGDLFGEARDCAPNDATINPGAEEICDGRDNDCDGLIDEEVSVIAFWDRDGDGVGDAEKARRVCSLPEDGSFDAGDCDDLNAAIYPGADELCDGKDNDCDDEIDEGVGDTFYQDLDGDGRGTSRETVQACSAPDGYSSNDQDCDDAEIARYFGAEELCDGIDNDCDLDVDEDIIPQLVWADLDDDGYGDPDSPGTGCGSVGGWSDNDLDCDDTDADTNPDTLEIAGNGLDEDCDGYVDERAVPEHYVDVAAALLGTSAGDVIQLGDGFHFETFDLRGHDVVFAGEGCDRTVVYADGVGTVLTMDMGTVENMTLTGGAAGGLLVTGDVTARAICSEYNFTEEKGGGIRVMEDASLHIEDSRIVGNSAKEAGGGLHAFSGSVTGTRLVFEDNIGTDGGAVAGAGSSFDLRNVVFVDNYAEQDGGGLVVQMGNGNPGALTLMNATFHDNRALGDGQAMFAWGSASTTIVTATNVLFSEHSGVSFEWAENVEYTFINVGLSGTNDLDHQRGYFIDAVRGDTAFVDADAGDFRLSVGSAFIDTGDAGRTDPDSSVSDIGAHGGPDTWSAFDWGYAEDADFDGLSNGWEARYGLAVYLDDAADDPDGDGLNNTDEAAAGTDPTLADTDGDGVSDGDEVADSKNPLLARDQAPDVLAGHDQVGFVGSSVALEGDGLDPNGDTLTYAWTLDGPFGASVTAVDDPTSAVTSFTPDADGTWTATLTASDANVSREHTVEIEVVEGLIVPDDHATIQAAIDASPSGDGVGIRAGTYTENLTFGAKTITLVGLDAASDVVIDGGGVDSVVVVEGSDNVTLARLTLTGGDAEYGGGAYVSVGTLNLFEVVVAGNEASEDGGGIAVVDDGFVVGSQVVVRDNTAGERGGGLSSNTSNMDFEGLRVVDNVAAREGGGAWLRCRAHDCFFNNVLLQGNEAGQGGALWYRGSDTAGSNGRFENVVIADNQAIDNVVYLEQGFLNVVNALFVSNVGSAVLGKNPDIGPGDDDLRGDLYVLNPAFWQNAGDAFADTADEPGQVVWTNPVVTSWIDDGNADNDLFAPRAGSPLLEAGFYEWTDRDGSRSDIGVMGDMRFAIADTSWLADSDGDGMSDGWEMLWDLDPNLGDGALDPDLDGLDNAAEWAHGSDPTNADTDGDGVNDGDEVTAGGDPTSAADHRPVADAGPDLIGNTDELLVADGSASSDPNGDALTYAWRLARAPPGSATTTQSLSGADGASVSFVPDLRGEYVLGLVVNDGTADSSEDSVNIEVHGDLFVPGDAATLEQALAVRYAGETIVLSGGDHPLQLDAGFTDLSLRGFGDTVTWLVGDGGMPVMTVGAGDTLTLESLGVRDGIGNVGGGVACSDASVSATSVRFEGNLAVDGGAIGAANCDVTLVDVIVVGNGASNEGGGVRTSGGSLSWTGGGAIRNRALTNGGGLSMSEAEVDLRGLVFLANLANEGGALFQGSGFTGTGDFTAEHLVVLNNGGNQASIYVSRDNGEIRHSVIAGSANRGLYVSSGAGTVTVAYDGFYDNGGDNTWPGGLGSAPTHVKADPRFRDLTAADPQDWDVRLAWDSPLIDAGDPLTSDPDGSTADIGAWGGYSAENGFDDGYADDDLDGLPDAWEGDHGVDDPNADPDLDTLTNLQEAAFRTDPNDADSDGDGVEDGDEVDAGDDPASAVETQPVADAGADHVTDPGVAVVLDGVSSTDPLGGGLTYVWTVIGSPNRSAAAIGNASSQSATFNPDYPGKYEIALEVDNGVMTSAPDVAVIMVTGDLEVPQDYDSVNEAVLASSAGATVTIESGAWDANVVVEHDLSLVGAGRDNTVIVGVSSNQSVIAAMEDVVLSLSGLTITQGRAPAGGGVDSDGAFMSLTDVAVAGCAAVTGGGIHALQGTLDMTHSRVVDNVAHDDGGGVRVWLADAEWSRVLVAGNKSGSGDGGGVYVRDSPWSVSNAIFANNHGTNGGAIYAKGESVSLVHVTGTGNTASVGGSFYYTNSSDAVVRNSIIAHNPEGAAVWVVSSIPSLPNGYDQTYSLAYDNPDQNYLVASIPSANDGNLTSNPRFTVVDTVDWTKSDWSLTGSSAAIDAGDPASADDPDGSVADMGAFGGDLAAWTP